MLDATTMFGVELASIEQFCLVHMHAPAFVAQRDIARIADTMLASPVGEWWQLAETQPSASVTSPTSIWTVAGVVAATDVNSPSVAAMSR